MKLLIAVVLVFCAFQSSYSQKDPMKFGVIPMEDMKMERYNLDTSASAVVLGDFGKASVQLYASSLKMDFYRHVRIKILKKDGLDWANAYVSLHHDGSGSTEERVMGLKASTYNLENGQVVETEMSKDAVVKEKVTKTAIRQKFSLPNVKVGSVVEYSYTLTSEYWTSLPNWEFQRTIPTRWSDFWAIIPESMIYEKYTQGYVPVFSKDFKQNWSAKDVPAFKAEPYMTCEDDYISRINFALSRVNTASQSIDIMSSWEKLSKNLMESDAFGGAIKGNGFLKKTVEEVTAGKTSELDRITAIHNYIKNTIEYNGTEDFLADPFRKVIEAKKGTSGDINLLFASMLDKAGFDVDMILLSTRDHGFVRRQYPMRSQFNYTVCQVRLQDRTILLDATEKYLPYNILPERCLNGEGLIISKINTGWIPLEGKVKSKKMISADLALTPDGSLKGKIKYSHDGYDGLQMRKAFFAKGKETYEKDFKSKKTWELSNATFENTTELSKPVHESFDIEVPGFASVSGTHIYLNPFLDFPVDENPFKLEKRLYPVDFATAWENVYMSKIAIPEGYAIEEAPTSKIISMPGNAAKLSYNVTTTGQMLVVTCILHINKPMFGQDEYPILREFFNALIAKEHEEIVLKKI